MSFLNKESKYSSDYIQPPSTASQRGYLSHVVFKNAIFNTEGDNNNCSTNGAEHKSSKSQSIRNLTDDFYWRDIPMLAVITGVNGSGKTALLESILKGFSNVHQPQSNQLIQLHFSCPTNLLDIACIPNNLVKTADLEERQQRDRKESFKFNFLQYFFYKKLYPSSQQLSKWNNPLYPRLFEIAQDLCGSIDPGANYLQKLQESVLKVADEGYLRSDMQTLTDVSRLIWSLITCFHNCIEENEKEINSINQFLKQSGFKYIIAYQTIASGYEHQRNRIRLVASNLDPSSEYTISSDSLSPGESMQMLAILWKYRIYNVNSKMILLLDEPDAHLHPSQTKPYMNIILNELVEKYKIQVILVTHHPTTVRLVPRENLFIMDNGHIERAVSQRQAVQLLTDDTVLLHDPFRIVFVEAIHDQHWYTHIYNEYIKQGLLRVETSQLLFRSYKLEKYRGAIDFNTILTQGVEMRDATKADVIQLVKLFTAESSTLSHNNDVDSSLNQFVFGIVDRDNTQVFMDRVRNIVAPLGRYSLENFMYDPIHLFAMLLTRRSEDVMFTRILIQCKAKLAAAKVPPEVLQHLEHIYQQQAPNCTWSTLIHSMQYEQLQSMLQIIIDEMFTGFESCLQIVLTSSTASDVTKHLKHDLPRRKLGKFDGNNRVEYLNKEPQHECFMFKQHKMHLKYPQILLQMQGHDLAAVWKYLAPTLISTKSIAEFCLSDPYTILPFCSYIEMFEYILNPTDTRDYFSQLQQQYGASSREASQDDSFFNTINEYSQSQLLERCKQLYRENLRLQQSVSMQTTQIQQLTQNAKKKEQKTPKQTLDT